MINFDFGDKFALEETINFTARILSKNRCLKGSHTENQWFSNETANFASNFPNKEI